MRKTIETRPSVPEDIADLKKIWKACFGDEDSYIDFYFDDFHKPENAVVLLDDGKLASMSACFPVTYAKSDSNTQKLLYVYAFATAPDYRGKGYGAMLLEELEKSARDKGCEGLVLVPANEGLFGYYGKLGFSEAFFLRETEVLFTPEAYERSETSGNKLRTASAEEYNQIRNSLLSGIPHIQYDDSVIRHQKGLSLNTGADLYVME
ncbi:MAG: GNAT family N-acetyltransferase, partial [Clostridiales bacterium]|nr:GNAT family N-acetyltransferase [Clostridiales bacterium]